MRIAKPSGGTVVVYPLIERNVISGIAERIVIDDGAIKIDHAADNLDNAHLVLDGVLTSGQDYVKVVKNGVKLLNIDHTGKLFCHEGIGFPDLTTIENFITALQSQTATNANGLIALDGDITVLQGQTATNAGGLVTVDNSRVVEDQVLQAAIDVNIGHIATNTAALASGTHVNTHDTLVKRNNNGTTSFHDITTNVLSANQAIAIYGDATIQFVPQDDQGQNLSGYTYRFGRNSEELGDLSGTGAGLEFKDTLNNEVLMQVNKNTPHIELKVNKEPNIPFVRIRNNNSDSIIEITEQGIIPKVHIVNTIYLTPGALLQTSMLGGYQSHVFELGYAWLDTTGETRIEFSESQSSADFHLIENIQVCLDDRSLSIPVSDITSRIVLKRWGVYRNTNHILEIVLGCDFHSNAIEVEVGSRIRVTFNNKKLL